MKRLFNIILSVLLLIVFSGCTAQDNVSNAPIETDSQSVISEEISSEASVDSISSEPELIEAVSSKEESTAPVNSEPQSAPSSTEPVSRPVISTPPATSTNIGKYIVNDPENTRGLSNVKSGFSFGVAKDGMPNSISVNNQAKFDSMSNIDALALDTVSTDRRMYLTFDCGYEYKNLTGNILDTLREKNVKAAFFVTLSYIKSNPQFVRRMIDEGHIVGNHSATHPVFPEISRTKMAEELYLVDEYLQNNFGYTSRYFRFPAGENSENSLELVTSLGYKSIFWSLAYADYDTSKQVGYNEALQTVTSRFHPGAVILLHAVSQDNADTLPSVIDIAREQGYTFKTLDDYYNSLS